MRGSPPPGGRCRPPGAATPAGSWPRWPPTADGDAEGNRARALVLLGTDVVGDFPDAPAGRAGPWRAAEFVVAVAGHPSATVEQADVVLPAAVDHERPGTTTNIEGRVSRLGQKVVAPGLAWPDWMIAAELAAALGGDLGLGAPARAWGGDRAPGPGLRRASPPAVLGVAGRPRRGARAPRRRRPGRPGPAAAHRPDGPARACSRWSSRAPRPGWARPSPLGPARAPAADAPAAPAGAPASLSAARRPGRRRSRRPRRPRSTATRCGWWPTRRLYDAGGGRGPLALPARRWCPRPPPGPTPTTSTAWGWAPATRCGCARRRGSLVLPAEADTGVPRGVVAVEFNLAAGTAGRPTPRGHPDRRRPPRSTRSAWSRSDDRPPCTPLLGTTGTGATPSTPTGWAGSSGWSMAIKVLVAFAVLMVAVS